MKKEIFLNFIFTFFTSVLAFVQNKYFIQYMGIEILGMMKLFTQILAYLSIVELGIGGASTFALYKPLAEKNYKKISIIINTMENLYIKIAIIILGLGILITPFIYFFIKTSIFSKEIYFYWILYVLNTISTYFYIKYIILFTANQEILYVKKIQFISKFLFQILQIFFIIYFHSFFIYITLLILDNIFQWINFRYHFKKKYSFIKKTKEKYIDIKKNLQYLFWHQIGYLIVYNTDLILISKFTSLEIVGLYSSYQMILQALRTLVNILTGILSPRIGKFIVLHNKKEIYSYFKILNIFYCFIATIFTYCMFVLSNSFVNIWLVKIIPFNKVTLSLICFNLWVDLFRWNLDSFKAGSGFFNDIKSPIIESIINFTISVILGIKFGLDGIIIGTIISNIVVILIYKPILVFKICFKLDLKEYIKVYINYFILVSFSFFSLNFISNLFMSKEILFWKEWLIYGIKVFIISFLIITFIFLLNKDFRNIIKIFKKKEGKENELFIHM